MPTSAKFLAALFLLTAVANTPIGAQTTAPPATVTALTDALKDTDVDVRRQAAWALGRIRGEQSIDALIGAMRDNDRDVRRQVIWALGQIRSPKAVDALTAALKDANNEVRRSAAQALAQIYGRGGANLFSDPSPNPNPNPNPRPRPF